MDPDVRRLEKQITVYVVKCCGKSIPSEEPHRLSFKKLSWDLRVESYMLREIKLQPELLILFLSNEQIATSKAEIHDCFRSLFILLCDLKFIRPSSITSLDGFLQLMSRSVRQHLMAASMETKLL